MDDQKKAKLRGKVSESQLKKDIERLELDSTWKIQSLEKEKLRLNTTLRDLRTISGHLNRTSNNKSNMSRRGFFIDDPKSRRYHKKISISTSLDSALAFKNKFGEAISSDKEDLTYNRSKRIQRHSKTVNGSRWLKSPNRSPREENSAEDNYCFGETIAFNKGDLTFTRYRTSQQNSEIGNGSRKLKSPNLSATEESNILNNNESGETIASEKGNFNSAKSKTLRRNSVTSDDSRRSKSPHLSPREENIIKENFQSREPVNVSKEDLNSAKLRRFQRNSEIADDSSRLKSPNVSPREENNRQRLPLIVATSLSETDNGTMFLSVKEKTKFDCNNNRRSKHNSPPNSEKFYGSLELFEENDVLTNETKGSEKDVAFLHPGKKELSKSALSLPTAWYDEVSTARTNINTRLSQSMVTLEAKAPSEETVSTSRDNVSNYLYAPPDGLPRTMFTLPSEDELFSQARCARYLRTPGTKLDPIEQVLDVKQIFQDLNSPL